MESRSPCSFIDTRGPVTIAAGGTTEIRSFAATTLRPQARLRFLTEPDGNAGPARLRRPPNGAISRALSAPFV